jgi:hypothetical protein
MKIVGFIWLEDIVEKLETKHHVTHLAQCDALPDNFNSLEELWEFWDTHSSADYENIMEPVEVEIDLSSSKVYCSVAKDLLRQVRAQAHRQGVSTETLINLWLQEKLYTSS